MFFNNGSIEGTNSSKCLCLIFVYVWFVLCLCRDWFRGCDSRKGWCICENSFEMRINFAYDRVWSSWGTAHALCSADRTIKIRLLTITNQLDRTGRRCRTCLSVEGSWAWRERCRLSMWTSWQTSKWVSRRATCARVSWMSSGQRTPTRHSSCNGSAA